MPIDITCETIVSLSAASKLKQLPLRRAGKRIHTATLFRWCIAGCRGVKLEWIQVGGSRCTSIEALQRFFDRLTAQSTPGTPPAIEPARLPKYRRQQIEEARRELARAGYGCAE